MIAELLARTRVWEEQSAYLTGALAEAGGTVSNPWVTLTMLGGRIQELEFTDKVPGASPVRVREAVREAYARAAALANDAVAEATGRVLGPEAARAIRESVAPEIREAAEDLPAQDPPTTGWPAAEVGQADLDRLDALLDSIDTEALIAATDPRDYLADLGYHEVPHAASADWQADLDREVAAITANAEGLAERLGAIRVERVASTCAVTVNGHGALLDFRLRPAAASRSAAELTAEFAATYEQALAEASQQAH